MNETIQLHSVKSDEALTEAKIMLDNDKPEWAVNRSYYSHFYLVQALNFTKGVAAKSHQGTIIQFNKNFIKTGIFEKKYNNILQKSLDQRLVGDYEIGKRMTMEIANEIYKDAIDFSNTVKVYFQALNDKVWQKTNELLKDKKNDHIISHGD